MGSNDRTAATTALSARPRLDIVNKAIHKSCIMRNALCHGKQRFLIAVKDKLVDVKLNVKQDFEGQFQRVARTH
jgi:hypothetical protein